MERWQQFDRREQGMLLLVAGGVALLLLWWIVVQPLRGMVADQQADNRILIGQLQEAREMALELKQLRQSGAGRSSAGGGNLQRLASQTMNRYGLGVSDFRPNSDNSLQLRFERASFNTLLEWLHHMEMSHNVLIESLNISPTPDSGVVAASLRLRSR